MAGFRDDNGKKVYLRLKEGFPKLAIYTGQALRSDRYNSLTLDQFNFRTNGRPYDSRRIKVVRGEIVLLLDSWSQRDYYRNSNSIYFYFVPLRLLEEGIVPKRSLGWSIIDSFPTVNETNITHINTDWFELNGFKCQN